MKAIVFTEPLPASEPKSLLDMELPRPEVSGCDLLVRVEAIAVNPVDTKVRSSRPRSGVPPWVLGWDAAGVVEAVGPQVTRFKPGEAVYYAGELTRPGCYAEYQLVDERLVGHKPAKLSFAQAAALPLTTLTAWESLFDRLDIDQHGADAGRSLLIIGGGGGVGSIAIQLARLAGVKVLATASRPETQKWALELGADLVLDHQRPLGAQLAGAGFAQVDWIANFHNTNAYWHLMAEAIRPQGRIVCLVENSAPLEMELLKSKSATFVWEFMFTRSLFQTPDMEAQGTVLEEVARLVDSGRLRSTLGETLSPINAANLRNAHLRLESHRMRGKLVLEGWPRS